MQNNLQEFRFYIDKKVTMWIREHHIIDAENEEIAQKIMIDNFKKDNTDNSFFDQTELHETQEFITIEENSNNATQELYTKNGVYLINDKGETEI